MNNTIEELKSVLPLQWRFVYGSFYEANLGSSILTVEHIPIGSNQSDKKWQCPGPHSQLEFTLQIPEPSTRQSPSQAVMAFACNFRRLFNDTGHLIAAITGFEDAVDEQTKERTWDCHRCGDTVTSKGFPEKWYAIDLYEPIEGIQEVFFCPKCAVKVQQILTHKGDH